MGQVQTVLGPVEANRLGVTLMHEHVFVLSPEIQQNWPTGWDEEQAVASAVVRLNELAAAGVSTIVDLTVVGLGRNIRLVKRVAEQVDLNIVVATGLYTYDSLPHYFDYRSAAFRPDSIDALEEFFLLDIEDGIAGSGVRPGILKCATDKPGVTPGVERVLRAVAKVHRRTGIPISTHTDAATHRGLEQQQIFEQEGVDLSRVVIGHSGDTTDLEYLEALVQAGSTLGMDRFGVNMYCPTEQRIETVVRLCDMGWANQIVLSHDAACHIDWFDEALLRRAAPDWQFLHVSNEVIPKLRELGVTDAQVDAMMVETPRRLLDNGPGY
ncbi:MAG: phosphotriesterase [Acidimicrobiales bacterium]